MRSTFNTIKNYDWILNISAFLLIAIGLTSLFSTSPEQFQRQLIWIGVGVVLFIIMSSVDYRIFAIRSFPSLALYVISVIGVIAVYVVGITVRGSERWLDFGIFWVQPVEPLKIALILILAKYFSQRHIAMHRLQNLLVPAVYVLIPGLLVFSHPDLGSLIVLLVIWMGMLFVAGIKFRHTIVLIVTGAVIAIVSWQFLLRDYQKDRILAFLDASGDPLGSGYNAIQSVITVSSGGFWGRGIGEGTQSQLGFLPEVATDFIFASVVEEMGAVVGLVVLLLFGVLMWRFFSIASATHNNFARLAISGVLFMFAIQIFSNVGMVLGLLPITGLTLPLMSYGGSSVIVICAVLGLVQNIHAHNKWVKQSLIHEE